MNNIEFSNEFDTLINSYKRFIKFDNQQAIDVIRFDEYEKSVFLTQSQEEIVLSLYNGNNILGESFEETESVREALNELVHTFINPDPIILLGGLSPNSVAFNIPNNLNIWFKVYESVMIDDISAGCKNNTSILVKPISHDDYFSISRNPFKAPNLNRAYRVDISSNNPLNTRVEIISKYKVSEYYLRYLKRPNPIILEDLNNLNINGITVETECELSSILHREILKRAVLIALKQRYNFSGSQEPISN